MLYNRRKRREWLSEQQRNYDVALSKARDAEAAGTLTPDLALVLNKERAILAAEEEQKNKKGVFASTKEWLFGGLAKEDRPSGAKGFAPTEIQRIAEGWAQHDSDLPTRANLSSSSRPDQIHGTVSGSDKSTIPRGPGMLDALAQRTAHDVESRTRSWINWVRGRSESSTGT